MSDTQVNATVIQPAAPRWPSMVPILTALLGALVTIGGLLIAVGGWRAEVDAQLADLNRRMEVAEGNQRTYIPILVKMTSDVSYLADRARREDDRQDREHR